jgi:Flp pilus assembly pilin Flp
MHVLMKIIRRFLADETGATAIEYGLIAAGIALAIIAVVDRFPPQHQVHVNQHLIEIGADVSPRPSTGMVRPSLTANYSFLKWDGLQPNVVLSLGNIDLRVCLSVTHAV